MMSSPATSLCSLACAAGLESVYVWEGKVQSDAEVLLKIKTRRTLVSELTSAVKHLHPYEECEVTAVDVTAGSDSYLQWVRDSTKEG
jgi:periplasmic divalent cation tolerance protein